MDMKTREQCGMAAEDFMVNRGYTYGTTQATAIDRCMCASVCARAVSVSCKYATT